MFQNQLSHQFHHHRQSRSTPKCALESSLRFVRKSFTLRAGRGKFSCTFFPHSLIAAHSLSHPPIPIANSFLHMLTKSSVPAKKKPQTQFHPHTTANAALASPCRIVPHAAVPEQDGPEGLPLARVWAAGAGRAQLCHTVQGAGRQNESEIPIAEEVSERSGSRSCLPSTFLRLLAKDGERPKRLHNEEACRRWDTQTPLTWRMKKK